MLPDNMDYMMAPVEAGLCKFESLLDGTLDLAHVDLMNDTLRVKSENEARMYAAAERKRKERK